MPREDIMQEAIDLFGETAQLDMVIEEMAELTQSILKYRREKYNRVLKFRIVNISGEHADVKIMLDQLAFMMAKHDPLYYDRLHDEVRNKVVRLANRIDRHKNNSQDIPAISQ